MLLNVCSNMLPPKPMTGSFIGDPLGDVAMSNERQMIPTDIETFAEVKGRNKLFSLPPVGLQKELDGVQGVREDRRG